PLCSPGSRPASPLALTAPSSAPLAPPGGLPLHLWLSQRCLRCWLRPRWTWAPAPSGWPPRSVSTLTATSSSARRQAAREEDPSSSNRRTVTCDRTRPRSSTCPCCSTRTDLPRDCRTSWYRLPTQRRLCQCFRSLRPRGHAAAPHAPGSCPALTRPEC